MRYPNRIDDICARLAVAWKIRPDLRLGQLVIKAPPTEPFYTEDEPMIEAIEDMMSRLPAKPEDL